MQWRSFLVTLWERDIRDAECFELRFSGTSIPLRQRWRNNGLSAGFLGPRIRDNAFNSSESTPSLPTGRRGNSCNRGLSIAAEIEPLP